MHCGFAAVDATATRSVPGLKGPATYVDPNLATVGGGGAPGRLTVADIASNDGEQCCWLLFEKHLLSFSDRQIMCMGLT